MSKTCFRCQRPVPPGPVAFVPGPPPWWARRFQRLRSEFGVRFVLVEWSDGTLTVVTR